MNDNDVLSHHRVHNIAAVYEPHALTTSIIVIASVLAMLVVVIAIVCF